MVLQTLIIRKYRPYPAQQKLWHFSNIFHPRRLCSWYNGYTWLGNANHEIRHVRSSVIPPPALLLVYRRLAPQMWFRISVWFTTFVVVGSSLAITFVTIFPCQPTRAAWDISYTNPKCIDRNAVYKATAALGAITDLMVLAIPIPVVIPLQISMRQKIGLICFFAVGGV